MSAFDFGGSYLDLIDGAVQVGRGAASSVVGQTYNVYRLNANSSGQLVSSPNQIYKNFPAKLTHWRNSKDLENTIFDLIAFAALCDNTYLHVGDILYGQGYGTDGAMYAVADKRPLKQTVILRCEQQATVTRPTTSTSLLPLQPAGVPTVVKSNQYSGVTKATEQSLTLNNGAYSFSLTGLAAMVPFGLQPLNRLKELPPSKLPTDTRRETFLGYLPNTPGVIIEENDIISSGSAGDRYKVEQNYIAEYGLQGQILILEKVLV